MRLWPYACFSNRMDSGKFESASRVRFPLILEHGLDILIGFPLKPYGFHQVMRSLFIPLRLATDARGLELMTDLDPNIDKVRFTVSSFGCVLIRSVRYR
jgi:hypothetical protein